MKTNIYKYIVKKDNFEVVKDFTSFEGRQEAQNYLINLLNKAPKYLSLYKKQKNCIIFKKMINTKENEFIFFSINVLKFKSRMPLADYEKIKDLQNILKNEYENNFSKPLQDFNKF